MKIEGLAHLSTEVRQAIEELAKLATSPSAFEAQIKAHFGEAALIEARSIAKSVRGPDWIALPEFPAPGSVVMPGYFQLAKAWLRRNKVSALIFGVIALATVSYATGLIGGKSKEATYEAAKDAVNLEASLAGIMWANAYNACRLIDIPDVAKCAVYKGVLLQEKSAPQLASAAVSRMNLYLEQCRKKHDQTYCIDLVNRASVLSLRDMSQPNRQETE